MIQSPQPRPFWHVAAVTLLGLVVLAPSARAQMFGVWSDPAPTPQGEKLVGAHLLLGDLTGLMGQVRFGATPTADIGIQFGVPDFDANFAIAGDWRQLLKAADDSFPMDLAFDGGMGWWSLGNSVSLLSFDFGVIASKELATAGGQAFIPYGALALAIGRSSIDTAGVSGSSTDADIHFRIGSQVPMNEQFGANAEIQLSSRSEGFYFTLSGTYAF